MSTVFINIFFLTNKNIWNKYLDQNIKATPHEIVAKMHSRFFVSCIKISQSYLRMLSNFLCIMMKKRKQIRYKAVRRSLCGIALISNKLIK